MGTILSFSNRERQLEREQYLAPQNPNLCGQLVDKSNIWNQNPDPNAA